MPVLSWIGAWEATWWAAQKIQRRQGYARALQTARRRGKPLLIVGVPDGEYPCGDPAHRDLVVDLRSEAEARAQGVPHYLRANVEDLPRAWTGRFGAAFCSFTLSHVCDPRRAWAELNRVADRVYLVEAAPWRGSSYLVPGRRWITLPGPRFVPIADRACNRPSRYG